MNQKSTSKVLVGSGVTRLSTRQVVEAAILNSKLSKKASWDSMRSVSLERAPVPTKKDTR